MYKIGKLVDRIHDEFVNSSLPPGGGSYVEEIEINDYEGVVKFAWVKDTTGRLYKANKKRLKEIVAGLEN